MAPDLANDNLLSKPHRLLLGVLVLLLVDIIWVSSSEATKYLYHNDSFQKPFFATYVKTSMFSIYLLGLCFWPPWRDQCSRPQYFLHVDSTDDLTGMTASLSDPQFVPIKRSDRSSGTESDDSSVHSVRFSKMAEVRHMSAADATEALLSRLSYTASLRAGEVAWRNSMKLPVTGVVRLAFMFCFLWFIANYTFQLSLKETEAGIVTLLSSSSGLFTLLLTAIFPANNSDRFTLSKLLAVGVSIGGLVLVCYSDLNVEKENVPIGAILSLASAFFYAAYLVFIRRQVDNEDKMDIPMFFGFVGVFTMGTLWPLFFLLHYYGWEEFQWPDSHQWLLILVNGLVGTVLSEVLWLWGCFLTSSLVATMAISLTIPMSMIADVVWKKIEYPLTFYIGIFPCTLAFIGVTLLAYYETWDPAMWLIRRGYLAFRRSRTLRSEEDSEQTEALIGIINGDHEA